LPGTPRHSANQLETFLRELDAEVASAGERQSPPELLIIGGAAASLAYGFTRATLDIDLYYGLDDDLRSAIARVVARLGLAIPVGHAAIADAPYSFEERLRNLEIDGVEHLRLRVPAPQDLIVMKLLRGAEHDLDAAVAIASNGGVTVAVLLEAMLESSHAVGSAEARRFSFLADIARIYGDDVAEKVEPVLASGGT
jgi:hypothetical protein